VTDWIWILWYENQNCQIVWSWHTPLPPFLLFQSPSLLCPFFSFMSDLTSSWTIPSNKMDKTSQPTTPELQVLYLLTSLPTELLTKPDWQWCVCVFFLCFGVCLITSVEECATWWLFFVGFLFSFSTKN
jgi:hypothetical protein